VCLDLENILDSNFFLLYFETNILFYFFFYLSKYKVKMYEL